MAKKKGKRGGYAARKKALRQALGVSSSPQAPRAASEETPPMMGAPGPDARRVFTFTLPIDGQLHVVEAYFCVPEGLFRLQSSPTTPKQYAPWSRQMMAARDEETMALPQRVRISDAMLKRKIWEIGDQVLRGKVGHEVNAELAQRLGQRVMQPVHPARDIQASGRTLSALEMSRAAHRVRTFLHTAPQLELKQKWKERGDSALITSEGQTSAFGLAVGEWIGQWGMDAIDELLLDSAYFYHAIGDGDAATTFLALVQGQDTREREGRIAEFATQILVAEYS